jgi:hypothetical protein
MSALIQHQKLLYHLTAFDNLKSILKNGLQPRSSVKDFEDIAEKNLINFRNEKGISHLIPFHFFSRTPFAGIVQKNNPETEFIYITIHRDFARENNFKIIPTHPKHMEPLEILEYDEGFQYIDWELMNKRDYSDYECKEVCMAECVAPYNSIPAKAFHSIIVRTEAIKKDIEKLCEEIFSKKCEKVRFFIDVKSNLFIKE